MKYVSVFMGSYTSIARAATSRQIKIRTYNQNNFLFSYIQDNNDFQHFFDFICVLLKNFSIALKKSPFVSSFGNKKNK